MVASWSRVSVSGLIFVGAVTIATGCFMADCPRGGKRSELETFANLPIRQVRSLTIEVVTYLKCLSCGPKKLGNCVADNICCGRDIGCYMGTAETTTCLRENSIAMPCQPTGKPCGLANRGVCVARGVCCTGAACVLLEACNE